MRIKKVELVGERERATKLETESHFKTFSTKIKYFLAKGEKKLPISVGGRLRALALARTSRWWLGWNQCQPEVFTQQKHTGGSASQQRMAIDYTLRWAGGAACLVTADVYQTADTYQRLAKYLKYCRPGKKPHKAAVGGGLFLAPKSRHSCRFSH